jgi:hypothetical protein
MRFSRVFKLSLLVILALSIAACSATPTRRSFKEGWKDSVVSTKVKYKLARDKLVKKRNLDVDAWRGVVTITGRVTSMEEKERAEQLAWQVKGVRGVDNFTKLVDDYTTVSGEAVADGAVTEIDITEVAEIKETASGNKAVITIEEKETTTVKSKVAARKPASHPMKRKKAETPILAETKTKTKTKEKFTAKRGRYEQNMSVDIQEESLTSEESLAMEAAEELRRLRGE